MAIVGGWCVEDTNVDGSASAVGWVRCVCTRHCLVHPHHLMGNGSYWGYAMKYVSIDDLVKELKIQALRNPTGKFSVKRVGGYWTLSIR